MNRLPLPLTLVLLAGVFSPLASSTQAAERAPNVVLILIDDLGWRDVGFMGNDFVDTPHLDRLAKSGTVFTQAYASAPNCAPTRACLMSGQWTPRHGIYTVVDARQRPGARPQKLQAAESKSELATEVVTIAEALAANGYATGFFGMWNLGRGRRGPVTPGGQGFQTVVFPENLGFGKDEYFDDSEENYLSDRLTDEALKFAESNRDRPFFVYLADHAVHAPYNPKPELLQKYERKAAARSDRRDDPPYAATIEAVDQNVGRIVAWLEQHELLDDTILVFTSDNGGTPRYTAPLRGSKGELYEGGIRVPLVVANASRIKPGVRTSTPITTIDLYPTLLEWAGAATVEPTSHLDGVSFARLVRDEQPLDERPLYWHFPCYVGRATPCSCIRLGDWKLLEFFEDGGRVELYNLRDDPNEKRDLSRSHPAKTSELLRRLRAWQQETKAAFPVGRNERSAVPAICARSVRLRGGSAAADRLEACPTCTPS